MHMLKIENIDLISHDAFKFKLKTNSSEKENLKLISLF